MPDNELPSLPVKPPAKDAPPTPANVKQLQVWLDTITAFGTYTKDRPWLFYEEIEAYLGPWGDRGYPIPYGKKYCVLFSTDSWLQHTEAGKRWVRRTLVFLQVYLKDFIVQRFRKGTLGKLTADELAQAAFDSHPKAYTQGGLTLVAMLSPLLLLKIGSIPGVEFNPLSRNFGNTVKQVVVTVSIAVPECVATLTSSFLPGQFGTYATAAHADAMSAERARKQNQAFIAVREAMQAGRLDHVGLIDELISGISSARWQDPKIIDLAKQVVGELTRRRASVVARYRQETTDDASLRFAFQLFDPAAF